MAECLVAPGFVGSGGLHTGVEEAGDGVDHDAAGPGEASAGEGLRDNLYIVAHTGQRLDSLRVDPVIYEGLALGGVDAGRRDRLLDAHPEVDPVGDDVGDAADDPAAAGRSDGEEGLTVSEQQHGRHVVHPALVPGD